MRDEQHRLRRAAREALPPRAQGGGGVLLRRGGGAFDVGGFRGRRRPDRSGGAALGLSWEWRRRGQLTDGRSDGARPTAALVEGRLVGGERGEAVGRR